MKAINFNSIESPDSAGALDRDGPMTLLSETEMEQISGGDKAQQCAAWRAICVVAGFASFGGLLGALIFGPTTFGCLLDTAIDFSHC